MADKFPILDVAKASLLMPLNSPVNIVKALGLLAFGFVGLVLLMVIFFAVSGGDLAGFAGAFEGSPTPEQIGQTIGGMDGALGAVLGMLLGLFLLLAVSAHIFNFWVRFATFGKDGAGFPTLGKAASAAATNGVKIFLILVLIMLVSLVLNFVLSRFGLVAGVTEQAAITDLTDQYLAGFAFNIIVVVVTCFTYSMFSANLTQTAVGNDKEGMEHPHTTDFAVVLMLIYASIVIPMIVAALIGSDGLFMTVQYLLSILILIAVPAAHGLRYKICSEENVKQVFEDEHGGDDPE